MSTANPQQPLDSRLLSAMKRLRLENISLQRQMRTLQSDCETASCEANESGSRKRQLEVQLTEAERQLQELQDLKLRVETLEAEQQHWESQRQAITGLAQRQTLELQELRTMLADRDEQIAALQQANQAVLRNSSASSSKPARSSSSTTRRCTRPLRSRLSKLSKKSAAIRAAWTRIRPPLGANRRKGRPRVRCAR